jgi:tricorn protease-like protein
MAYTPISREWRTWKRTRGGRAQDIWLFDLEALSARRLTDHVMTDNHPMWIGNTVYFTSDRAFTLNLHAYDLATGSIRQLTRHADYDVLWPSSDDKNIVYECGGYLWIFDTAAEQARKLDITVGSDGRQGRGGREPHAHTGHTRTLAGMVTGRKNHRLPERCDGRIRDLAASRHEQQWCR